LNLVGGDSLYFRRVSITAPTFFARRHHSGLPETPGKKKKKKKKKKKTEN